jgi:hypothetical protein
LLYKRVQREKQGSVQGTAEKSSELALEHLAQRKRTGCKQTSCSTKEYNEKKGSVQGTAEKGSELALEPLAGNQCL